MATTRPSTSANGATMPFVVTTRCYRRTAPATPSRGAADRRGPAAAVPGAARAARVGEIEASPFGIASAPTSMSSRPRARRRASARPTSRGRARRPDRGPRGTDGPGARARRPFERRAAVRPTSREAETNACSQPRIGPRTTSPLSDAANSTCTSACPFVGTPARVETLAQLGARLRAVAPTASATTSTPRAASARRSHLLAGVCVRLRDRNCGVVSGCSHQ